MDVTFGTILAQNPQKSAPGPLPGEVWKKGRKSALPELPRGCRKWVSIGNCHIRRNVGKISFFNFLAPCWLPFRLVLGALGPKSRKKVVQEPVQKRVNKNGFKKSCNSCGYTRLSRLQAPKQLHCRTVRAVNCPRASGTLHFVLVGTVADI